MMPQLGADEQSWAGRAAVHGRGTITKEIEIASQTCHAAASFDEA